MNTGTILVVESERADRESIGSWLEDAGFLVMACPGPQAPGYVCLGGRKGSCPLIEPADVVVLDLRLPGEDVMEGTAAAELLALYASSGKPVVAFGPDPRIATVFTNAVDVAPWSPDARSLVGSVRAALESRRP